MEETEDNVIRKERRKRIRKKLESGTLRTSEYDLEAQNVGKLVRSNTYTLIKTTHNLNPTSLTEDSNVIDDESSEGSENQSPQEKRHSAQETTKIPPVPAPRKLRPLILERDKFSSDTDKDITEIDLDDGHEKSERGKDSIATPTPKPRKAEICSEAVNKQSPKPKVTQSSISQFEPQNQLPLVEALQKENRQIIAGEEPEKNQSPKENVYKKKDKKAKKKSSAMIGSEARKIPKIAALLKDLRAQKKQEKEKHEEVESKIDFQIDSPRCPESVHNGMIYVQHKSGFYAMGREEVLRNMNSSTPSYENQRRMTDSTASTAASFQKYWSRITTYFHGILAGFALCHAAAVTALMIRSDYQPSQFVDVYSCLSLKIHYIFYALTALCIVSCFDRIDVGHANRRHWRALRKVPSVWLILVCYLISFGLTLANQKTEARFEVKFQRNRTHKTSWVQNEDNKTDVFFWYHSVWARDALVLLAWFVVCITQFADYLQAHLGNMVKYVETKN